MVDYAISHDAIARRLFIVPCIVKVHLSCIFAKLGITTRAELAAQDMTAR
jgi:DNA-binding NarL/FixJ family response regulator